MIVAFGHCKYTGKDTFANFLMTHLKVNDGRRGRLIRKTGFATKLKSVCHDLYGWAGMQGEQYYEDNPEKKDEMLPALGKTVRRIWIEVGNYLREVYPETWVEFPLQIKCDVLLIKDLRYPNEAEAIQRKGGLCIRIDNPRVEYTDDEADRALKNWSRWDGFIINDGDLASLNRKAIDFARERKL